MSPAFSGRSLTTLGTELTAAAIRPLVHSYVRERLRTRDRKLTPAELHDLKRNRELWGQPGRA